MISRNLVRVFVTFLFVTYSFAQSENDEGTVASLRHQTTYGSSDIVSNKKQVETKSESATAVAMNALKSNNTLQFDRSNIIMKTPASLEIENDSSENFDSGEDESTKSDFDELTLTQTRKNSSESFFPSTNKNVYKVPRKDSSKKTEKSFMPNIARSPRMESAEKYFQIFVSLFDHYAWNIPSLESKLSQSPQCFKDIENYLNQLKLSNDWAVKTIDASGRYRGMFFFENDYWLGSKQFCYEINNDYEVSLQFFVVQTLVNPFPAFNTSNPRLLYVGQCLPKSCSTGDIAQIINDDPSLLRLNAVQANAISLIGVRAVPGSYNMWEEKRFYFFGFIVLVAALLVIWSTFYEYYLESKGFVLKETDKPSPPLNQKKRKLKEIESSEMSNINNNNEINFDPDEESCVKEARTLGSLQKILLCFAYRSNSRVILCTRKSSKDSLSCIHGMRLFSLLWTVMVHTYLQVFSIGENRFNRKIAERTIIYQVVGNATYSVDTFFFIGGLLVVLLFLRTENEKKKNSKASDGSGFFSRSLSKSFLMIFYRFLRLTPTYLIIIVCSELVSKVVKNDSVFTPGLPDHITCEKYWWRNMLYINNFYPLSEICMMWSWYLANDFQFYVVTVLLLILSTRYIKLAVFSSGLLLTLSWIVSIYMSISNKYTHKVAEPFESFDILYDKPWQRFGPYAMGMITGYILYRFKNPPKITKFMNLSLWILSLVNMTLIVFGVTGGRLSIFLTSLYVSFGHTAWGLSLCWITLSCCWNMARPVNSFLSYGGFLPFSRLTYCAYLIHPSLMLLIGNQFESPFHLKHGMVATIFLGNATLSFIVAYIISIMFEAPVIRFLKLCFRK